MSRAGQVVRGSRGACVSDLEGRRERTRPRTGAGAVGASAQRCHVLAVGAVAVLGGAGTIGARVRGRPRPVGPPVLRGLGEPRRTAARTVAPSPEAAGTSIGVRGRSRMSASICRHAGAVVPPPASRSSGTGGPDDSRTVGGITYREGHPFEGGVHQTPRARAAGEARPCTAHPRVQVRRALAVDVRRGTTGRPVDGPGRAVVQLLPRRAEDAGAPSTASIRR